MAFFIDLGTDQKSIKNQPPSKSSKKRKKHPWSSKGSLFDGFWMTFGLRFPSNFMTCRNLLFCNKHQAKTSFLPLKASHFCIKISSIFHVFSRTPPGPPFFTFYVDFMPKLRILGPPLESNSVQNGDQNHHNSWKNTKNQLLALTVLAVLDLFSIFIDFLLIFHRFYRFFIDLGIPF